MTVPLLVDGGLVTRSEAQSLERWARANAHDPALALSASQANALDWLLASRRLDLEDPWIPPAMALPGHMAWWARHCSAQLKRPPEAFPWACLLAAGDALEPEPHETWLVLVPAALAITPQQVGLRFPTPEHRLPPLAREALEVELAHLGRVAQGRSGQLYLCITEPSLRGHFELLMAHPDVLVGQHLPDFEPGGDNARTWRHAAHRVQMAWHALAQSAEDGLLVDTLWAWGAGHLLGPLDAADSWLRLPPRAHRIDLSASENPARDWFIDWTRVLTQLAGAAEATLVVSHQWAGRSFAPPTWGARIGQRLKFSRRSLADLPALLAIADPFRFDRPPDA